MLLFIGLAGNNLLPYADYSKEIYRSQVFKEKPAKFAGYFGYGVVILPHAQQLFGACLLVQCTHNVHQMPLHALARP